VRPLPNQLLLLATHFFLLRGKLLTAINRLLSVLSSWAPQEGGGSKVLQRTYKNLEYRLSKSWKPLICTLKYPGK
jgi:hypothetical protein